MISFITIKNIKYLSSIILLIVYFSLTNNAFSAPILRIEVGQHTAMINRMAVDKDAKLLATASDDKTVRLWNLPEGTLYTTLRVPIDEHSKGDLYAVAVSPDGKTVITSGETIDSDKKFSLYVFDVENRILKARISNLPSSIFHLAYSKDGKYFAAAFSGGYGIRIWNSQTGKLVAQDTGYSERSNWLDFSGSGYLATVSHDGYVRVYDNNFTLIKNEIIDPQGKPNSISFSENGQLLAIGYSNLLQVDITDLNLNKVNSLPTENLIGTNTAIVAWQKNSNTALFASGDMKTEDGQFVVRHWQEIGSPDKSFRDIKVSKNIVTDIISVADGGNSKIDTLFSSADPSWGSLKNDELIYKNHANLWDARSVELPDKIFSISEDGLKIAYSQHHDSNDLSIFDITQLTLKIQGYEELLKTLSPSIKENKQINITNWQRDVPIFNGKTLDLDNYEKSLTLAIDSKSDHALIGTNYYLRWYDVHGKEIKKITVPSGVYGVNIAANGKLAVAALGDGTIRWYSLIPGEELDELVTLFPYNNSKDWIVWTKEGFFGNSDGGGYRLAGYHLNKGENKRPEWIEFSQVYQTYYAPELILPKLLRQEDKIKTRLKTIENIDDRFNKNAVPIIELVKYCTNPKKKDTKAFIRVSASEIKADNLSYMNKINFFLGKIYNWLKALFNIKPSNNAILQVESVDSSDLQDKETCHNISGQGETRGFTRKEKIQTTIYRNQLDKNTDSIKLYYVVKPREGGIGDIDIYVNGQIQETQKQISSTSSGTEDHDLSLTQNISLKEGENEISIQAYEKTGGTTAKSDSINLINPSSNRSVGINSVDKPRLIVLAVGIDNYQSPNELKYAVKDSTDFLATIVAKKSSVYSEVISFQLLNEQATLKNIESTFDKIALVINENDPVLIYLSGHGLRDERDFYFIPYGVEDNFNKNALSQPVLKRNIAKLSKTNKIFILLDSCHSGAVDLEGIQQEIASFDKIKHQLGDNIFILAAASGNQEAQDQFEFEGKRANNGLFAYVVLKGLNGKARLVDDNIISNQRLGDYVQQKIDEITENQTRYNQKARFQQLKAGDILNFDITQYE